MQAYIERSRQIRRLSMPPESKEHFYGQFRVNFLQIRELFAENKTYLDEEVFAPLADIDLLSEEKAQELLELSDHLAYTETLEMVDVRLAFYIVNALEPYYKKRGDRVKYIHTLFRQEMLAYNVGQIFDRGRLTDALAGTYRACIITCAEKAARDLDDIEGFAALPEAARSELLSIDLFRATGYERPYYDKKMILKQIYSYQAHIRRLLNPALRRAVPEQNWDKLLYSAYTYQMDVQEFLDWHKTPDYILRMLDEAGDQALALMEKNGSTRQRDPSAVLSGKKAIGFYRGTTGFEEMVKKYADWASEADPNAYDQLNMSGNVMPIVFVQGLCREHPEKIDSCREFLKQSQQKTFDYIRRSRDKGAYNTMQRFIGYMMDYYIELEDGIPFKRFFENLMVATQPTLTIHCSMVAEISGCMLDTLLESRPELLIGVCGCKTLSGVRTHADEIRGYLRECCILHDTGKLFFLDTINLFNRTLADDEFALIRLHAQMGYEILHKRKSTRRYAKAALYHHRWYNEEGGYPKDVSYKGEPNAILYQILTCADCIDAATDSVGRAYSRGKTFDEMMADLQVNSGRMFNPDLVALFGDAGLRRQVESLLRFERERLYNMVFAHEGPIGGVIGGTMGGTVGTASQTLPRT